MNASQKQERTRRQLAEKIANRLNYTSQGIVAEVEMLLRSEQEMGRESSMPAIYASYEINDGDSPEVIRQKLYLGVISAGEQAYTLGAAIAECRKELADAERRLSEIDKLVSTLRDGYQKFKKAGPVRVEEEG